MAKKKIHPPKFSPKTLEGKKKTKQIKKIKKVKKIVVKKIKKSFVKKRKLQTKQTLLIKRGRPSKGISFSGRRPAIRRPAQGRRGNKRRFAEKPSEWEKWLSGNRQIMKTLRGMRDILPEETKYWDYVIKKSTELAQSYGFKKFESPILEERALFEKSSGGSTDVVEKQMYEFTDKGGNKVVMRPEFTPAVVRAYIEHGMFNLSQPVKLFYFGPLFRYERPQAGRLREFWQFGLEVIGSDKPVVDAQLILFSQVLFANLGVKVNIQVNSLGCAECQKDYRVKLVEYFKLKKKFLCKDCQRRLVKNPLRILDCKNSSCKELMLDAPQLVDGLCEDCKNHFVKVLEYLDGANVTYELNPYLVRGLDYYTRTVFEFLAVETESLPKKTEEAQTKKKSASPMALGGGGRYDNLVEHLNGRPTPAVGLSYGLERIVGAVRQGKAKVFKARAPRIFLAQLGDAARQRSLRLFEDLRKEGFRLTENLAKNSLRTQLEIANKLGVKLTLILGQQEVHDNTIIVRNMNSGNQETVDQEKIVKVLKKILR